MGWVCASCDRVSNDQPSRFKECSRCARQANWLRVCPTDIPRGGLNCPICNTHIKYESNPAINLWGQHRAFCKAQLHTEQLYPFMLSPPVLGILDKTDVALKQREGGLLPPIEFWSYKTLVNALFWEPVYPPTPTPATSDSDSSEDDERESQSRVHIYRNRRKRYDAMRVAELVALYFSESPWETKKKLARVSPLNCARF